MKILAADHVLPVCSPPLENGAICIEGDSIAAVGTRAEVMEQFPSVPVEDMGRAAIIPGLVNCHSHLELTAMRNRLDDLEHDFTAWLLGLNGMRAAMSSDEIAAAAIAGAREGARAGVTCFGDIGRMGRAGLEALKSAGLRGVVFQETSFSADDRTAESDFDTLVNSFASLRADETELVKAGISPHSPYTVGPKLLNMIAGYAIENDIKLTIHTAESTDEDTLLKTGKGFFTEVYRKYGVEWTSPGCSPVEYLDRLGLLAARPLLAHCICVSAADLGLIADSGAAIAHCPKSNAKLGHGSAPFEMFLDREIPVGLGTDSVASNNVCDILEEARFGALMARNRPGSDRFISPKECIEAATIGGARALGLDQMIGTLEPGKQADLVVVALTELKQQPTGDIHAALVYSSSGTDVVMTMVAGREVFRVS